MLLDCRALKPITLQVEPSLRRHVTAPPCWHCAILSSNSSALCLPILPCMGTGPSTGSPPAIVSYGCRVRWHYLITKLPQPLLALPPPASQSSSVVEQVQQVKTEIKVVQSELPDHLGDIHFQHNQQDTVQGGHTAQPIKFVYESMSCCPWPDRS